MTSEENPPGAPAPVVKAVGCAGRNLPAAIASGVVLLALIAGSLPWKPAFVALVTAAILLGVWDWATPSAPGASCCPTSRCSPGRW